MILDFILNIMLIVSLVFALIACVLASFAERRWRKKVWSVTVDGTEYFAPCRLQAGLTRSAAQMRTRVCALYSPARRSAFSSRTNRGAFWLPAPKRKGRPRASLFSLEQATGIEPAASAWEAEVLPLDYACVPAYYIPNRGICQSHLGKSLGFL